MTHRAAGPVGDLLIGQPEISERLMRALTLKGALPQHVDGRIGGSITVMDLTQPDYSWLRREQRFLGGSSQGAVVGEFGIAVLGPRPGSVRSTLCVAYADIQNQTGAAGLFRYGFLLEGNIGSALAVGDGGPMDDRVVSGLAAAKPNFGIGTGSQVADPGPVAAGRCRLPADGQATVGPFILTNARDAGGISKWHAAVYGSAVNQAVLVTWRWTERTLMQSEVL